MRTLFVAATAAVLITTVFSAPVPQSNGVTFVLFDGGKQDFSWIEENDPVMGGVSTNCTFVKSKEKQAGIFSGVVQNVPSLKAPGFCFARTNTFFSSNFEDASNYTYFQIEYKT